MNIKEVVKNLQNIDTKIIKIVKIGVKISFILCLISSFVLITYNLNSNPLTFYIGISLFESSLFYIITFIICGYAFNKIKNDII